MNAKNDLGRITRDHHEDGEDDHRDENERHKEDEESFDQIGSHLSISILLPKEKA